MIEQLKTALRQIRDITEGSRCVDCESVNVVADDTLSRADSPVPALPAPPSDDYKCSKCGASGCRLWRQYQTFLEHIELLCFDDALKDQSKNEADLLEPYHAIGWLVAAIPTDDGTFWGYTSVPQDKVDWWNTLPLRPAATTPMLPAPTNDVLWSQLSEAIEYIRNDEVHDAALRIITALRTSPPLPTEAPTPNAPVEIVASILRLIQSGYNFQMQWHGESNSWIVKWNGRQYEHESLMDALALACSDRPSPKGETK